MSTTKRLIVVDEDADFAWLITQLLTPEGWQVSAFTDGDSASTALQLDAPTAVLLNLHLAPQSGFECLHRWQSSLPCPIVVLSALPSDTEQDKALALGAAAYLPKPFSHQQLTAALHSACAGAAS